MKLLFSRRDLFQEAAAGLQGPDVMHTGTGVRIVSSRPSPAVEAGDVSAKWFGHFHPAICFSCDLKALTDGVIPSLLQSAGLQALLLSPGAFRSLKEGR